MKILEILCSPPCGGKTTYTNKRKRNKFVVSISRDEAREECFSKPYIYTKENERRVTSINDLKLKLYLNNDEVSDIIIDNTHCKEEYIDQLITQYGDTCIIRVKFFNISFVKAHYRNVKRYLQSGKWIPFKVINQMILNYNKINKKKYEKYYFQD